MHLLPNIFFVTSSKLYSRTQRFAPKFNIIVVPSAAENTTTATALEVTNIAESYVPVMQTHVGQTAIGQGLINFVNVVSEAFVAVVSHTGKSSSFLFVAISALAAGFVGQHVETHLFHVFVIPDLPHAFFFKVTDRMFCTT